MDLHQPQRRAEIQLAGKTGTAEIGEANRRQSTSGSTPGSRCFAPYDDPEIALTVSGRGRRRRLGLRRSVADRVLRAYFEITGPAAAASSSARTGSRRRMARCWRRAAFPTPGSTGTSATESQD